MNKIYEIDNFLLCTIKKVLVKLCFKNKISTFAKR